MKKSIENKFVDNKGLQNNYRKFPNLIFFILIAAIFLFSTFNGAAAQSKNIESTPWPDLSNPIPLVLKMENLWDESYEITVDGNGDLYQEITLRITYEDIPAGYYPVLVIQTIGDYFQEPEKSVLVEGLPIIKQKCDPNILSLVDSSENSDFDWEVCDFLFALGVTDGSDKEYFQKISLMRKNLTTDGYFGEGIIKLILFSNDVYSYYDGDQFLPIVENVSDLIYVEYLPPSEGNEIIPFITEGSAVEITVTPSIASGSGEKPKFPLWIPLVSSLGAILYIFRNFFKQLLNKGKPQKKHAHAKERVKIQKMDLKPPTLRFTAPKPGSIHAPSGFDIVVEGKRGSHPLIWKTLTIRKFLCKRHAVNQYRVDWKDSDALKSGPNTLSASIKDNVGQSASAQASFYVDAEGPDLALTLEKGSTSQSTMLENDLLIKKPKKPSAFRPKGCSLQIMVRENPDEHFIGIKTSSIKLTADFPCCGFPAGKNLWETDFIEKSGTKRKMDGILKIPDAYPLPGGKHTFHLSAEDEFGNASQIDLVFGIDVDPPLLEIKLSWFDLKQSASLTKDGLQHQPEIPPTFPCRDIKLNVHVWEPKDEPYRSGIDRNTVKLYIESADFEKSSYSKPREISVNELNLNKIFDTENLRLTLSAADNAGNRSEMHLDLQVDPSMQEGLTIVDGNQRVVNQIYYGATNRMGPFFLRFHVPETSHNVERILPGTETGGEYDPKLGRSWIRSEKLKKIVFDTKYTFAIGNEDNWLEKKAFTIPSDIRTMLPALGEHKSDGETLLSKPFFVVISDERDIKPEKTGEDAYRSTYFNIFAHKGDFLVVPSHLKKGIIDISIKNGKSVKLHTKYLKSHRAQIVGGSAELVSIRGTLWDKSAGNVQNTIVAKVRVEAQQRVEYDRASIIFQQEDGWKKEIKAKCKIDGKGNLPGKQQEIRFSWPVDSLSPINLDPSKKLYAKVKLFNNEHKILNVSTKLRHVEFPNCSFLNIQPEEKINPLLDRNHDGKADSLIRVSPKKEIPSDYKFQLDFIDQDGKGLEKPFETEYGEAQYDVLLKEINPNSDQKGKRAPYPLPKQGNVIVQQIVGWKLETYRDQETNAKFKKPFLISIGSQTAIRVEPSFELQLTQIQLDRKMSIDRVGKDWEDEREYYLWHIKHRSGKNAFDCSLNEKKSRVTLPSELRLPDPESQDNTGTALVVTRPEAKITFRMEAFGWDTADGKKKKYPLGGGIKLGTLTLAPAGPVKDGKFSMTHSPTYPEKGRADEKEIAGKVKKNVKKVGVKKEAGLLYKRGKDGTVSVVSFQAELVTRKVKKAVESGFMYRHGTPSSNIEIICEMDDDRPGVQAEIKIKLDSQQDSEKKLAFIEMPYLKIEKLIAPGFIEEGETVACRIGLGPKEQKGILDHLKAIQTEDAELAERITKQVKWFAHSSFGKEEYSRPWHVNDVLLDNIGEGNPILFTLKKQHIHRTKGLEKKWPLSAKMIHNEPTAYLTIASANIKSIYFNVKVPAKGICNTKKWEIKMHLTGAGAAYWLDVGGAYFTWEAACIKDRDAQKREWDITGYGYLFHVGFATSGAGLMLGDLSGNITRPLTKKFPTGLYTGLFAKMSAGPAGANLACAYQTYTGPMILLASVSGLDALSLLNSAACSPVENVVKTLIKVKSNYLQRAKTVIAKKYGNLSGKDISGYGISGVYIILNMDESKLRE